MYHNNNAYIETKYTHYLSKNQGFLLQLFENYLDHQEVPKRTYFVSSILGENLDF